MFPVIDRKADTVFYVINYDPKGFIVLAADERSIPILAFTPNNSFKTNADRFPYGLVKWLEKTRDDINYIRNNNLRQKPRIAEMWENLNYQRYQDPMEPSDGYDPNDPCEITYEMVSPLLNTHWSQRCGYNDSMPLLYCADACFSNNNGFAGCVPIAIAQIMKYHEYPTYNWSNMPSDYGTTTTASFIRDIWDAIPAPGKTFTCNGTGVYTNYIPGIFINDFNYSSASLAGYNHNTVEQQLDFGRPVILTGGRRADAGWWIFHDYYVADAHAWVCDGYIRSIPCPGVANSIVLHMNWGWYNGTYNGWYGINDFTPGGNYYSYGEEMIYNIIP